MRFKASAKPFHKQKHPREKLQTPQHIYAHTQDRAKKPVKVIVFYRWVKLSKTNFSLGAQNVRDRRRTMKVILTRTYSIPKNPLGMSCQD